jgi:hypothetical protein
MDYELQISAQLYKSVRHIHYVLLRRASSIQAISKALEQNNFTEENPSEDHFYSTIYAEFSLSLRSHLATLPLRTPLFADKSTMRWAVDLVSLSAWQLITQVRLLSPVDGLQLML